MLEHVAITYSSILQKLGGELNEKIFQQIVVIQVVAVQSLDPGIYERMRFKLKNEVKLISYRYVLENIDILRKFVANQITKNQMQNKYAQQMTEQLEESILKRLDD